MMSPPFHVLTLGHGWRQGLHGDPHRHTLLAAGTRHGPADQDGEVLNGCPSSLGRWLLFGACMSRPDKISAVVASDYMEIQS